MFEKKIMCPPLLLHPLQGSPARVLTSFRPPSTPLGSCWALQLLWEIGGWEALHWCWLLTSPPLLRPCWARQLWEVPGDDNSSHCRLVPLCLGVHWDVHLVIVDEAGLAGLPEQRLAFFITSYYKQIQFLTLSTLWSTYFMSILYYVSLFFCSDTDLNYVKKFTRPNFQMKEF